MTGIVAFDLWPSHGKRCLIAVDMACVDACCADIRRRDAASANQRRLALKVRQYRFDIAAPHTVDDWDDFIAEGLEYQCLRAVLTNKPLPIVAAPDETHCIWFQSPAPKNHIQIASTPSHKLDVIRAAATEQCRGRGLTDE